MTPTLQDGQLVQVDLAAYERGEPSRGDVILLEMPVPRPVQTVKRIIGLPGETVKVRAGSVYVDGRRLAEFYVRRRATYSYSSHHIGPDEYFVLGDNRNNSADSHLWGMLPRQNIIGKVVLSGDRHEEIRPRGYYGTCEEGRVENSHAGRQPHSVPASGHVATGSAIEQSACSMHLAKSYVRDVIEVRHATVDDLLSVLETNDDRHGAAREELVRRARFGNKKALAHLVATLSHDHYYTAEFASESFWLIGSRAVAPLIAVLRDRHALLQARILAAEALNQLGSRPGTAAQLEVLQNSDEDIELRRALARYVGYIGDESSLEPLVAIVLDESVDHHMRHEAIYGLASLLDRRAVEPLLRVARGDDRILRYAAVQALDELGGAERYLAEGPGKVEPRPRRFRDPFPTLYPPAGSKHGRLSESASRGHLDETVELKTRLGVRELAEHYNQQLRRKRWKILEQGMSDAEAWSRWGFETRLFREGSARLTMRRDEERKTAYTLEFHATWQPAAWFSLNQLEGPFFEEDEG